MPGFREEFVGVSVPLPTFSNAIHGDLLSSRDIRFELRDGYYRDYVNYSLAMDRVRRAPIVVAANIDQSRIKEGIKRRAWFEDTVIGREYQLNNDYYYKNRWDRGHMARRATAAWGDDRTDAKRGSDDTMVYTNAHLQWDHFNKDEWAGIERWVRALDDDANNRLSVFTGPIYEDDPIFVRPSRREPAEVPAAFFKIVCFQHRNAPGKLAVRAFLAYQDKEAKRDRKGFKPKNLQFYQTTVAQIEDKTGLIFAKDIATANPLLFYPGNPQAEALNVRSVPENIPVDCAFDITDPNGVRVILGDDETDVFISGALVNPRGSDAGAEWVSILNLQAEAISVDGWKLTDNSAEATLSGTIAPGQAMVLQGDTLAPVRLGNSGDILTLFDNAGRRIARVRYRAEEVVEGRAIAFSNKR